MMSARLVPPNFNQSIVDASGIASRPWYVYLSAVGDAVNRLASSQASAQSPPANIDYGTIRGIGSISTIGALPNVVTVALYGDQDAPGFTYYYGTNGIGSKGWYSVSSTILTTTLSKVVNANGTTNIELASLSDAGGGSLRKFSRDAYGRVSGTSAATTDDLPEGSSHLYYTDSRVDDRIAVSGIQGILPVVNGDIPPTLVYAEDGSLIYTGIF